MKTWRWDLIVTGLGLAWALGALLTDYWDDALLGSVGIAVAIQGIIMSEKRRRLAKIPPPPVRVSP